MRQLPLLFVTIVLCAQTVKPPSFDDYKVREIYKGKLAAPKPITYLAREYRSQIRDAAEKGPNFAGKYTIAQWGCGSQCVQMVVVDEKSGEVYRGPFTTLTVSVFAVPDQFEPVLFRLDSRLLIVRGCPEENTSKCAEFFYEWDGKKFTLRKTLHPAPAPPY